MITDADFSHCFAAMSLLITLLMLLIAYAAMLMLLRQLYAAFAAFDMPLLILRHYACFCHALIRCHFQLYCFSFAIRHMILPLRHFSRHAFRFFAMSSQCHAFFRQRAFPAFAYFRHYAIAMILRYCHAAC